MYINKNELKRSSSLLHSNQFNRFFAGLKKNNPF